MIEETPRMADPVYVKHGDIKSTGNFTLQIYDAVNIQTNGHAVGVQQHRAVWVVFVRSDMDRVRLINKGISINNVNIKVYECNPFLNNYNNTVKVTIRDLPLNVNNSLVLKHFKSIDGLKLKSNVMYGQERYPSGRLSKCLNGERFFYAEAPFISPLQKKQTIEGYNCFVYHKNQTCQRCNMSGHQMMSPECPNFTELENIVFRSPDHVFCNFYNCDIKVNNEEFISTESAYQWLKCIILNRPDVAENVKKATSSKQAKQVVEESNIELANWNLSRDECMHKVLNAKLESCKEFRTALINSGEKCIAEATSDTYWGCGLAPNIAKNTKKENFPGKNVLGQILMKMRDNIILEINLKEVNNTKLLETVKGTRERSNSLPSGSNIVSRKIQPELLNYIKRSKKRKLSSDRSDDVADADVALRADSATSVDVADAVCDVTPVK